MTQSLEEAYSNFWLRTDLTDGFLKDNIIQKARDLLSQRTEPVPLAFAIKNYENLMKTCFDAGPTLGIGDVALQSINGAKQAFTSGSKSSIQIVIVHGSILQSQKKRILDASLELYSHSQTVAFSRHVHHGVSFVTLPRTECVNFWEEM
ncbi:hypothetical protein IQ07DRAFT_485605, partial [Pyrenochaeta sp. DS3sAY3a]